VGYELLVAPELVFALRVTMAIQMT
jgi:hypothetical protein